MIQIATKKGKETRERILEVSLELMELKGFDKLNIKEICKVAGISIGAFYHHFKGKDDLIIATYMETDQYFEELYTSGRYDAESKLTSIKLVIISQIELILVNSIERVSQLYKSQMSYGSEFFTSDKRYLYSLIKKYFEEANKFSEIEGRSFDQYTQEVLMLSRGYIYNWCIKKGSFNLKDKVEGIIDIYLNSLKK